PAPRSRTACRCSRTARSPAASRPLAPPPREGKGIAECPVPTHFLFDRSFPLFRTNPSCPHLGTSPHARETVQPARQKTSSIRRPILPILMSVAVAQSLPLMPCLRLGA